MKNRLLLIAAMAFTFFQTTAQTNGHFSFTWTMAEDGEEMLSTVDLYSSAKQFVIVSDDAEMGWEKAIIDRSSKKGYEFFSDVIDETERDNYYVYFDWDESIQQAAYVSDVFSGVLDMPNFNDELELLPEKATIAGIPCQKFRINLPEEAGGITGWIALGVHCLIEGENKYLDTDKGMILEMTMDFDGSSLIIKCTGYDSKFPETDKIYSMEVPAGFEELDDLEDPEEEDEE